MGKPVKGHIALWLIGQSTDDPRVHDMLRTLTLYSVARLIGPPVYHYGKLAAFVPSVAWHYWRGPKHPKFPSSVGRGIKVTSPHGEWPPNVEYTKPKVSVGASTAGTTRALALGGLAWLSFGTFVQMMTPSLSWFGEMALTSEDYPV